MKSLAKIVSVLIFVSFLWIVYSADIGQPSILSQVWHNIPNGDKYGHAVLFGTLTLAANILTEFRMLPVGPIRLLLGSLIVVAIATAEELSQIFFPKRTVDAVDLLAGMIGIVLVSIISLWWRRKKIKG